MSDRRADRGRRGMARPRRIRLGWTGSGERPVRLAGEPERRGDPGRGAWLAGWRGWTGSGRGSSGQRVSRAASADRPGVPIRLSGLRGGVREDGRLPGLIRKVSGEAGSGRDPSGRAGAARRVWGGIRPGRRDATGRWGTRRVRRSCRDATVLEGEPSRSRPGTPLDLHKRNCPWTTGQREPPRPALRKKLTRKKSEIDVSQSQLFAPQPRRAHPPGTDRAPGPCPQHLPHRKSAHHSRSIRYPTGEATRDGPGRADTTGGLLAQVGPPPE